MRWIIGGTALFAAFFTIALRAIDAVWPLEAAPRPQIVATPPLPAMTRTSFVIAPIAVANAAIRDAIEAAAPRDFTGRRDNVLPELLSKGSVDWNMTRGRLDVASRADALAITTDVNGTMRMTGQLGGQVGGQVAGLTRSLAGFAGGDIGQAVGSIVSKPFDQRAQMRGNVAVLARPLLTAAWRIEPNLSSQVGIANFSLPVSGAVINVGKDVKPMVDRAVAGELASYAARIRGDDALEVAARREWAKMCRSVALRSHAPSIPDMWLEMRPVRALTAQPRVGVDAINLVLGVEAETRILSRATQPDCPFPAALEIVPASERGRIAIALAIDLPFADVNRLLEDQLVGRSFPDDGTGSVVATIESASLAGAGDRLQLALRVRARGTGWFGFSAPADVFVQGRAVLDRDTQIVRLADLTIDVQSEAGWFGAAARAAISYLEPMLAEKAVIDLKPVSESTRASIEAALEGVSQQQPGVRVHTGISALRLTGIDFDAAILRLVAELDGTLGVEVTALPK